jgi:hypothetical protein
VADAKPWEELELIYSGNSFTTVNTTSVSTPEIAKDELLEPSRVETQVVNECLASLQRAMQQPVAEESEELVNMDMLDRCSQALENCQDLIDFYIAELNQDPETKQFETPTQIFKFLQTMRQFLATKDHKEENEFIVAILQRFALLFHYMDY